MLKVKVIKDPVELNELFKYRYQTFVLEDKDAPRHLYQNGLLKDKCDEKAYHVGCYDDENLVGFLTIVIKDIEGILPFEEQHHISAVNSSAEVMRLIILKSKVDRNDIGGRGEIMRLLLREVEKIITIQSVSTLYLVSTKGALNLYKRMGFKQIGDFKLYENISYECPMMMSIENFRINL